RARELDGRRVFRRRPVGGRLRARNRQGTALRRRLQPRWSPDHRLAAQPDRGLAGIIVLDGATATARSSGGGDVAIDVGGRRLPYAERQRLLDTVIADPSRPSPLPGYPSAGEALGDILYSAESFGGHGGLANTRARVSDPRVLATLLRSYDRWWPRAALDATPPEGVAQPLPVVAFASTQLGPAC